MARLSPCRTQRARLGIIQCFLAHLGKTTHPAANPVAGLELPRKQPRHLTKGLCHEELAALMNLPDIRVVHQLPGHARIDTEGRFVSRAHHGRDRLNYPSQLRDDMHKPSQAR